jgi:succinoglycan biosynthesis protein ExoA
LSQRSSVTVAIPVLDEERHLDACLDSIEVQTYPKIAQVLVIDGGSSDKTREIALRRDGVTLLHNPGRIQAAALNIALQQAEGDVFVRVDGHSRLPPDYVERCVAALDRTGAAMVGGTMQPVAAGWAQEAIACAMSSPLGAGPARFHAGGPSGWVDTVYLGAYRTTLARGAGGYNEGLAVNEDAEFAIRMARHGGVWFDNSIWCGYTPRDRLPELARQFYRYGRGRARTVRLHPMSVKPRQLAPLALLAGALSPWRFPALGMYAGLLTIGHVVYTRGDLPLAFGATTACAVMHASWAAGFLRGLIGGGTVRAVRPVEI